MSEEIDPLVIQRTQQKLGKYVQRPQLTEKLLRRPPFRFIHDIITAVISQYGVLENVFTKQELVSENIKEKEEKIAFLQKFIQHLSTELGEDINVRPSKIVAGIEAERTNDLLQALALILENKQNNKSQQKNTLGNDSKNSGTTHTPNKTAKTSNGINKPPPLIKKNIPSNNAAKENTSSKTTAKTEAINKQAAPVKTKDMAKTGINSKNTPSSKPAPAMSNKATVKSEETKKEIPGASNKKPDNLNKTIKQTPTVSAKANSRPVKEVTPPPRSLERTQENLNIILDESPDNPNVEDEPVKDTPHPADVIGSENALQISPDYPSIDSGITIEQLDTSNANKIRPLKPPIVRQAQDEGFGVDDMETQELLGTPSSRIAQLSPPQSNILNAFEKPIPNRNASPNVPLKRPSSGNSSHRPKSSRRPPSRTIRDRLTVIPQESRPITGQVPRVIIEGNPMSDDEEDRIVQAAVFDQATADLSQAGADELLGGEQGKLVEQILSAQREWDPLKDTESSNKESSLMQVQHLKANIQEMAQAALPLGQLIPLIHEDMETVQQEWQFWKKEADLLEEEYQREKTSVDSVVEKLQAELEQLDRMVLEHHVKLNTAKASVLKTEKDVSLVISNFGKKR